MSHHHAKKILLPLFFLLIFLSGGSLASAAQRSYKIEKVADGVWAALAVPGGAATSNAFIVDLGYNLIAGGAHLTKRAINDLLAAAADITPKQIEAFVLAHHHQGYSFVDFDFPPGRNVYMTLETRQAMKQEVRKLEGQASFFKEGLAIEGTERTLILTNVGPGHSKGDLVAYVPQTKTLFTSDLVYVNSAGFLGDGPLRNWVLTLEKLSSFEVDRVIPGYGPVSGLTAVTAFKDYLRDFLTEILAHIERGDDLYTTRESFSLPRYENLPGFKRFRDGNIERAFRQLSSKTE